MVTNPGKETLQKRRNRAHGKICQGDYGICPGFRDFINKYAQWFCQTNLDL